MKPRSSSGHYTMDEEDVVIRMGLSIIIDELMNDLIDEAEILNEYYLPRICCHQKSTEESEIDCLLLLGTQNCDLCKPASLYSGNWLPEKDFHLLFQMTRSTFNLLLDTLKMDPVFNRKLAGPGKEPVSFECKVLIGVSYLSSGMSMRQIGDKFGVCDSTVFLFVENFLTALLKISKNFIKWPSCESDCEKIADGFMTKYGFPGVIGAIDNIHIRCKVPAEHLQAYTNRNFMQTIILQAVCTSEMVFTNVFIGFPGGASDAIAYENCDVAKKIDSSGPNSLFFNVNKYHMIGDCAFPLESHLLVPFRGNGDLRMEQKKYNEALNNARSPIESAFAHLKGRWKRLQYVDVNSVEKAVRIVGSCCVLHNFCLLNNDYSKDIVVDGQDPGCNPDCPFDQESSAGGTHSASGIRKRQVVVNILNGN